MCADPEIPLAVFAERKHHIVRQAIPGRIRGERPVFQARQPAAVRADPQRPVRSFEKRRDERAAQRVRILPIADDESHAIEPHQPFLGSHPEVPVSGLHDRIDRVLRESGLTRPDRKTRLRQRTIGIEREGARSDK